MLTHSIVFQSLGSGFQWSGFTILTLLNSCVTSDMLLSISEHHVFFLISKMEVIMHYSSKLVNAHKMLRGVPGT